LRRDLFSYIFVLIFLFLIPACTTRPAAPPKPVIKAVTLSTQQVARYEPVELVVDFQAEYTNPFDARQVALDAIFKGPDGREWFVPGYWDADKSWRIRFTPSAEGQWQYNLSVSTGQNTSKSWTGSFMVFPLKILNEKTIKVTSSQNHGWLQVASWVKPDFSPRYLAYQDGTPFYGLGHCDAFTVMSHGYDPSTGFKLFDDMHQAGENMLVYWPVYSNPFFNNSYDSYSLPDLKILDLVVEDARRKGIYLVFTIWDHNELRDKTHPWGDGLWERQNGFHRLGDINSFFTGDEAWAWQENLYRYFIARWGYSTSIGLWMTVSEIDGTNAGAQTDSWLARVNDYFVKHDPYRHPTTASMAGDKWWPAGNQVVDVPQVHAYQYKNDPVYTGPSIAAWTQKMWEGEKKPNFVGEFGTPNSGNNPELFHNGIWAGLASGAAITPMEWNDSSQWGRMTPELYAQMAHLANFVADLPLAKLNPALLELDPAAESKGTSAWGIGGKDWGILWVQDITGAGYPIETVRKFIATPVSGVTVQVKGLQPGTYLVKPYDTWQGVYLPSFEVTSDGDNLLVKLPDFKGDLALKLEKK